MRQLEEAITRVAGFECPVLVTGETGCGKEEVARAIHAASPRRDRPFVAVNCGGVVAALAESQLFGHEKGSFTGAFGASQGVFRAADGGMVFLDEIGELPLETQPKLLRVLQRGEVTPVGATADHHVNVVVIAATNRDLEADVDAGVFREDLLYRLNTIHLKLPPLRSRPEDIPRFVAHFSGHFARLYDRPEWRPDPAVLSRLMTHSWPGNIRQLAQTVQRIYVFEDRLDAVLDELFASEPEGAKAAAPLPLAPGSVPSGSGTSRSAIPATAAATTSPTPPIMGSPPPPGPVPHTLLHRGLATAPPIPGLTAPAVASEPVPAEEQVPVFNLEELRRLAVRQALAVTGGHRGRAAQLLGVSPNRMSRLAADACPDSVPLTGRPRRGVRKPR